MKRFFRAVFLNRDGWLRPGWKLIGGVAAYSVVFYGALYGLAAIFGALFEAWGLMSANLLRAPYWAREVVRWHTDFCYALAYLLSWGTGLLLARKWNAPGGDTGVRKCVYAALTGLGMGAGLTVLALGLDCMRLERPLVEPALGAGQMTVLLVIVLGRASGEILTKRLIFDAVRERRWLAYLCASLASMVLLGNWASALGVLNALLLGVVTCALYERGGWAATTALTAGWTVWNSIVFGFPGMETSAGPVYALYHVSEAWLTGGNLGPHCGLWLTAGLLAGIGFMMKKNLSAWMRRVVLWRKKNVRGDQNTKAAPASAGHRRR